MGGILFDIMQLSRLEVKGFKSFGDQAIVNFDKGVTGIVGPNGCGKSNVVDSIRWVLGEQKTRALRSDKMENIIFNGTKKRKPAPMAQVSLTFDNNKKLIPSEYTKVTITRRYYRTGESEYLINDVRCRLKDINDLFLDTGIGSDSYAIIELKKVDEILNDKYQARRDLFEKAAGISKFKTRKKESLNKLDAVDKDLARVGDLLFEIEKNLRSLERQAKQAERYFKLETAYKKTSLAYARKAVKRQREIKEALQIQIERETRKRQELNQAIQNIEGLRENKKVQLDHLEKNLSFKQKQLNAHIAQIRQIENDKKLKNERVRFLEDKISNLRQQIQQDIQNQSRIKEEVSQLQIQLESANKQYNEAEIELSQLQNNYEQQKQTCAEIQQRVKSKDE
ncbi:MAG: AAA family ATPase, partial [Bacteroidota bacterium]